ncbi:hypothetical protein ITJ38_15350 [Agreia pratensis]|uniref:hypothetical protein n=1 Tax=Agreia pratensis TaxID=150121 RepID=UPI00188A8D19|nr:hypothetical protein [Agreia pratensis]MBF4635787.1 hypothetical protein [Agreia pratensis]
MGADTPAYGSSLFGLVWGQNDSQSLEPLDFGPDGRTASYEAWWIEEPVIEFGARHITRRQLVLGLANQDGGAHVDLHGKHISELRESSPTFLDETGEALPYNAQTFRQRELLHIQMRAVTAEFMHSISNSRAANLV